MRGSVQKKQRKRNVHVVFLSIFRKANAKMSFHHNARKRSTNALPLDDYDLNNADSAIGIVADDVAEEDVATLDLDDPRDVRRLERHNRALFKRILLGAVALLLLLLLSDYFGWIGGGGRHRRDGRPRIVTHKAHLMLRNGRAMPALGVGMAAVSSEETCDVLRAAVDQVGFRLIDTAAEKAIWYRNERAVGDCLPTLSVAREQLFVTTKLHPVDFGSRRAAQAVRTALDNLQTNYIDLLLFHYAECWGDICGGEQAEGTWQDSWIALKPFIQNGTIRALGVSNFQSTSTGGALSFGTRDRRSSFSGSRLVRSATQGFGFESFCREKQCNISSIFATWRVIIFVWLFDG